MGFRGVNEKKRGVNSLQDIFELVVSGSGFRVWGLGLQDVFELQVAVKHFSSVNVLQSRRNLVFGFWVSGFRPGFRVSGWASFRVSGFRLCFRVSGFRFRVSVPDFGLRCRVSC